MTEAVSIRMLAVKPHMRKTPLSDSKSKRWRQ